MKDNFPVCGTKLLLMHVWRHCSLCRANDQEHQTPFAVGAQKEGYYYRGGKLDDITVVVAYVTSLSKL